jgi:hypothetical protein
MTSPIQEGVTRKPLGGSFPVWRSRAFPEGDSPHTSIPAATEARFFSIRRGLENSAIGALPPYPAASTAFSGDIQKGQSEFPRKIFGTANSLSMSSKRFGARTRPWRCNPVHDARSISRGIPHIKKKSYLFLQI